MDITCNAVVGLGYKYTAVDALEGLSRRGRFGRSQDLLLGEIAVQRQECPEAALPR
jgi:hypothetical protein